MLNIGVIGCGRITEVRHAPEYDEDSRCRLTAWYDALPERARAMADRYGGTAYPTLEALLRSAPDAVSVCVQNTDHARVTVSALEAGCHVLCEKPMATSLADCERMVDTARRVGKRLMIGQNQRFARAHVEARRMLASGETGKVLTFHTAFSHAGPECWTGQRDSWFFDRARAVLGTLADLGIHKIDLMHYLLGEPITSVACMLGTLHKTFPNGEPITVDDNAFCLCRTGSGVMGEIHVSWTNYGEETNATTLYCENGALRLYDDADCSLIWERRDGEPLRLPLDELTSNKKQTEGGRTSTGVVEAFVDAILSGESSQIDATEVLKAMRVVFAAERAHNEKRVVEVG